MGEHSQFGGSKAAQWLNCPGSVVNQSLLDYADDRSPEAAEGTKAHQVAELLYEGWTPPATLDPDMVAHGQRYVRGLRAIEALRGGVSWVEKRVVDPNNKAVYGTVDFINLSGRQLLIADYKYGEGDRVEVKVNPQLLTYSTVAIRDMALKPRTVTMAIYQPRGQNPGWRHWTVNADIIYEYGHRMDLAIKAVEDGSVETKAGPWCRYCSAKVKCRAFKEKHLDLIQRMKDGIHTLSTDEIGSILQSKPSIKKWLDAIDAYVKQTINLTRQPFHGFTAVQRVGRYEWLDAEHVQDALPLEQYPELYKRDLKTPKQVLELRPDLYDIIDQLYRQLRYTTLVKIKEE